MSETENAAAGAAKLVPGAGSMSVAAWLTALAAQSICSGGCALETGSARSQLLAAAEQLRKLGNPLMPDDAVDPGIQYLNGATIRDQGYLQEANRHFFHPLGLALELDLGNGRLRVQDWRDDPEGVTFYNRPDHPEDAADLVAKANRVYNLTTARQPARKAMLGYWIQPAVTP